MIAFKNKPFCTFSIFHGFMEKIICYVQLLNSLTIKFHPLLVNAEQICKGSLGQVTRNQPLLLTYHTTVST